MKRHDELIDDLSKELEPVKPALNVGAVALAWVLLSAVLGVVATHLAGPARPGAFAQLLAHPRFLLESLLGVVAIAWVSVTVFRASIPAGLTRTFAWVGGVLMSAWILQYVIGLLYPALEPSSNGVRAACYFETMAYALPPTLAAVFIVRRLYPLNFLRTAMAIGLAAGMIPALYMQFACMYEPVHILEFHILPGLVMVIAGLLLGVFMGRRARDDSRR